MRDEIRRCLWFAADAIEIKGWLGEGGGIVCSGSRRRLPTLVVGGGSTIVVSMWLSGRFSVDLTCGSVRVAGMRLVPHSPTTNPKDEMGGPCLDCADWQIGRQRGV